MIFQSRAGTTDTAVFILALSAMGKAYSPIDNFFMADTFYYLILQL